MQCTRHYFFKIQKAHECLKATLFKLYCKLSGLGSSYVSQLLWTGGEAYREALR